MHRLIETIKIPATHRVFFAQTRIGLRADRTSTSVHLRGRRLKRGQKRAQNHDLDHGLSHAADRDRHQVPGELCEQVHVVQDEPKVALTVRKPPSARHLSARSRRHPAPGVSRRPAIPKPMASVGLPPHRSHRAVPVPPTRTNRIAIPALIVPNARTKPVVQSVPSVLIGLNGQRATPDALTSDRIVRHAAPPG